MGAGPRHALPKSAQIQGLLCEKDQLAGYAGSTAMQIGLDHHFPRGTLGSMSQQLK